MRPETQALYQRGLARFEAHDYRGAVVDFQSAFALDPVPDLLFAEAQAERLRGDCTRAVILYQRFLATNPPRLQVDATQNRARPLRAATGRTPATGGRAATTTPSAAAPTRPSAELVEKSLGPRRLGPRGGRPRRRRRLLDGRERLRRRRRSSDHPARLRSALGHSRVAPNRQHGGRSGGRDAADRRRGSLRRRAAATASRRSGPLARRHPRNAHPRGGLLMRAATAAVITVMVAATAGCLGPGDFRCGSHEQCGPNGSCEADGRCSLPVADEVCRSRRRYAHHAGPVADTCVPASCAADPIATFALGSAHACLVRAGGRIQCWGRNDDGQLGDGSRTARSLPVTVASLTGARAVATGQRHSCAIRGADRQVVCWGADDLGQLGDGGGPTRLGPLEVPGVNGAVAIAAGADFSCAALASGTVTCWGDASVGQLGDGRFAPGPHPPVTVDALAGAITLSAFPNTPAPSEATACSSAGARTRKVSSATAPPRTAPSPSPSMGFPTSAPSAPA